MKRDGRLISRREGPDRNHGIVPIALKQAGYMDHVWINLMQKVFADFFSCARTPCIGRIHFRRMQWGAEDANPLCRYQSSKSMPQI